MDALPIPDRIAFVSSNEDWGGSEELWSRAAARLAHAGARVRVYKPRFNDPHVSADALRQAGCSTCDLHGPSWIPRKVRTVTASIWRISRFLQEARLTFDFRRFGPELVVVSQGLNYDGWYIGETCRRLRIPYVLVSQKASDMYWPNDSIREVLRGVYREAAAACFVSDHNRTLTEEQIGLSLENARVVRNPFNASWRSKASWPRESGVLHLACLARLDPREKGQDLLFRVLATPKWRARPLKVSLFGSGHNNQGLRDMADLLGLDNVRFGGFVEKPETIWATMHGLVLPSRCEGLPLSIIEAMLHARIVITTDVGGNGEAIVDGVTGFLAKAPTEAELDCALERAWQQRDEWRAMGAAGADHARALVEPDPVGSFIGLLSELSRRVPEPYRPSSLAAAE